MLVAGSFLISLVVNCALFLVAFRLQTDKLTDLSYSFSFAAVAGFAFVAGGRSLPMIILLSLILIWSARLGMYLVIRINKMGRDKRFDGLRENFWRFGGFWLLQAATVPIVLLPAILFLGKSSAMLGVASLAGVAVWLAGLTIETIADYQKYRFNVQAKNRGRWIDAGLWHYSRHPNYFGEILVWVGIYIFAISNLSLTQSLIVFISPLYITVLLRYVSGVPPLETAAEKKWGNLVDYQEYRSHTGLIIPRF